MPNPIPTPKRGKWIHARDISRHFPHLNAKVLNGARRIGKVTARKADGYYWEYKIDDAFEIFQSRYLKTSGAPLVAAATPPPLPPSFEKLLEAYEEAQTAHADSVSQLWRGDDPSAVHQRLLTAFHQLYKAHDAFRGHLDSLSKSAGLDGLLDLSAETAATDEENSSVPTNP